MCTGIANLPLHSGRAPGWLMEKMVKLSREITRVLVWEHGPQEFLKRLSQPLGEDGTPYPVDHQTYSESIEFLNKAVQKAKISRSEKVSALRRLFLH